ncbi:hypothetical protein [Dactylosporangium sp. CA-233914]|uniref:hypothetical protein n=1 Tax=Dactylosporangium sp. CA-233914 TaxID=3239934 RepID=UPI003D8B7E5A
MADAPDPTAGFSRLMSDKSSAPVNYNNPAYHFNVEPLAVWMAASAWMPPILEHIQGSWNNIMKSWQDIHLSWASPSGYSAEEFKTSYNKAFTMLFGPAGAISANVTGGGGEHQQLGVMDQARILAVTAGSNFGVADESVRKALQEFIDNLGKPGEENMTDPAKSPAVDDKGNRVVHETFGTWYAPGENPNLAL